MNPSHFDRLTRFLGDALSRRCLLRGFAAATGLVVTNEPGLSGAKKKRKNRPKPNEFGCLNVGQRCGGSNGKCCSGISQGKKPKKGKKDKSTCVAHNTGGCLPEQDFCSGDPNVPCGVDGICGRTTGNAGYCIDRTVELPCAACKRDTDCELGFGPGAACFVCEIVCAETGNTLCAPPAA